MKDKDGLTPEQHDELITEYVKAGFRNDPPLASDLPDRYRPAHLKWKKMLADYKQRKGIK